MGSKSCNKNYCKCGCDKCLKARAGVKDAKHCYWHSDGCHKDCDGWLTA